MLAPENDVIRAYRERAAQARARAEQTTDPTIRIDLLEIEGHWLTLARSEESRGRVVRVLDSTPRRPQSDNVVRLFGSAFPSNEVEVLGAVFDQMCRRFNIRAGDAMHDTLARVVIEQAERGYRKHDELAGAVLDALGFGIDRA